MAKKRSRKRYKAVFERDEAGWWVASVPELDGCHTQGRSLAQARARLREAMSLFGVASTAPLEEEIRAPFESELREARAKRAEADRLSSEATAMTKRLATRLAKAGMSRRDVGELLGMSFQRVQQIVK